MSIQIIGNSGVITQVDGTTFRALRITSRPVGYGGLGSYRIAMLSGTMNAGLATASDVFQARWTDATRLALIWGVTLDGLGTATNFFGGYGSFNVFFARQWTADGSGGNPATLTGNNQKLRTSMGTSFMSAIRLSATGALTAGTRTLDSQSLGQASFTLSTLANFNFAVGPTPMYGAIDPSENAYPIALTSNEGIVCQATVPGNGTWQFGITMSWSEVVSY